MRVILPLCLPAVSAIFLMWRLSVASRGVLAFSTTISAASSSASSSRLTTICRLGNCRQQSPSSKYIPKQRQASGYTAQFAATTTDDNDSSSTTETTNTEERTWNLGGLQKEVSRLTVRSHKKIGKARQRLDKANQEVERLTSDPNVSLEELEECPNVEALEADLEELQTRLKNLNKLEVLLSDVKGKGKNVVLPDHVADLAIQLEINDEPPKADAKVTKKEKGPRNMHSFRLPYRRFYTKNKTEIRVRRTTLVYVSIV
jgi:hypothetical protein